MIDARDVEAKLNSLTRPKKRDLLHWVRIAALPVVLTLSIPALHFIDTTIFPVISHTDTIIVAQPPEGKTHVRFIFNKDRDCKLDRLEMFLAGRVIEPMTYEYTGIMAMRPKGRHFSRVFIVDADPERFMREGAVIAHHRCHVFWEHKTLMYGIY